MPADARALSPLADGRTAISRACAAWIDAYGAGAISQLARLRAFIRDGVWVVVTVGGTGLGQVLI